MEMEEEEDLDDLVGLLGVVGPHLGANAPLKDELLWPGLVIVVVELQRSQDAGEQTSYWLQGNVR